MSNLQHKRQPSLRSLKTPRTNGVPPGPNSPKLAPGQKSPNFPAGPKSPNLPACPKSPNLPQGPKSPKLPPGPKSPKILPGPKSPKFPHGPKSPKTQATFFKYNSTTPTPATVATGTTNNAEPVHVNNTSPQPQQWFSPRRMSAPPEPYDVLSKVMLIGDSGVGKTCLLVRFKDGRFLSGSFISTVGIDFRNKVVTVDETRIKLQIWDTAGQERFRSVTHAYYRDAHALLLLYDVTSKTSFDNIRAWLGEINEYAQEDVVIMLLGNKADCNAERVIRREDGERLAKEYNVAFMETSAKTGINVELSFMAVARELISRKSHNPDEPKFNVREYVQSQTQKPSCNCTP